MLLPNSLPVDQDQPEPSYPSRIARANQVVSVRSRLEAVPAPGLALTALVLVNLMWGGSLPATKLALLSFGPFTLATARLVLASALFVAVLRPAAIRQVPVADGLRMAGLGVVGFAGVQVLQAVGTTQTSGATATVLASTSPLWIAVLAAVMLREPLRISTIAGLVLALAGVAVITGLVVDQPSDLAGGLVGNVIVLLSSAAAAPYSVLGKGFAQRYSALAFCTLSCLGGALASLPMGVWEVATTPVWPTLLGWALLVYLAVLVTFFGFALWFWGLRALPVSRAGSLVFLQPVSGLVLASVLLGDRLTTSFLIGCVLVLAGIYLAVGRLSSRQVVTALTARRRPRCR
jgi:drug/metabolite transporter (DMT)-like permease